MFEHDCPFCTVGGIFQFSREQIHNNLSIYSSLFIAYYGSILPIHIALSIDLWLPSNEETWVSFLSFPSSVAQIFVRRVSANFLQKTKRAFPRISRKKRRHIKNKKNKPKQTWLVVEPTHLRNMSQNGFIFPKFRGEN